MSKPTGSIRDLKDGPAALNVPAAGAYLGLSRSGSYDAAKRGVLPTIKLGPKRCVVPAASLLKLLQAKESLAVWPTGTTTETLNG